MKKLIYFAKIIIMLLIMFIPHTAVEGINTPQLNSQLGIGGVIGAGGGALVDEGWLWPVPSVSVGTIPNIGAWNPSGVGGRRHRGIDIHGFNNYVVATRGGTIIRHNREHRCRCDSRCGHNGGLGNYIIIEHTIERSMGSVTFISVYAHLRPNNLSDIYVGADVDQGQLIGFVGRSGEGTGDGHLHFEIWHDTTSRNTGNNAGLMNTNPHTRAPVNGRSGIAYRHPLPPTITSNYCPVATQGIAFNHTLEARGTGLITWSEHSGRLPNGLRLNRDGTITGTPTEHGTFHFTVRAQNPVGRDYEQFQILVSEGTGNAQPSAPSPPQTSNQSSQIRNFTVINPAQQRFTTRDDAPVRNRPYETGTVLRRMGRTGTQLMVDGRGTNTRNNRWYSVQGGGWIYSGNLSTTAPTNTQPQQTRSVTLRENQGRDRGIVNETVFQFRATTDFDATRVVAVFSGGGQMNMNRTNARAFYLNSRLTVPGTQTITVHAYEGNTRRASHSMQVSTTQQQQRVTIVTSASNGGTATGGATVNQGQSVTVRATANSGWRFDGWFEGNTRVSSNATWTFNANVDRTLQARFVAIACNHSWSNIGICSHCNVRSEDTVIQLTAVTPQERITTRADAPVRPRPYNTGTYNRRYARIGSTIRVDMRGVNTQGNVWYRVVGGGWIYSGNVSAATNNQQQARSVTLRENQNRTTGITNETIFQFRATTDFDATRVVIVFDSGTQFNMNRTNARSWYLNSRLTTSGNRTIAVHAYEGNTRVASHSMQISSAQQQQNQLRSVTLRENQNRTSGITNETVFQFRATTDFDATRVVIAFSGGGQFNMNRTNARAFYLNSRLTTPGTQTVTVHAYEGNTRVASHSMQISSTQQQPQQPQVVRTLMITYNANGGSGAPQSRAVPVTENERSSQHISFYHATEIPIMPGYTFLGWRSHLRGGTLSPHIEFPGARRSGYVAHTLQEIPFYAQWQRN